MIRKTPKSPSILILCLFIGLAGFSIFKHHHLPAHSFRTEIWADRAGYYIYLPSSFIYGFHQSDLPHHIDSLSGNGFAFRSNKLVSKYTYGVALMQSPFFLAAHALASITGKNDGFSYFYQRSISVAAAFYLSIALWLLFASLRTYFRESPKLAGFALAGILFATNLFYYALIETGMSHIYSFFLFALLIYLIIHPQNFKPWFFHIVVAATCALIILIRPTNIVFLFGLAGWHFCNPQFQPRIAFLPRHTSAYLIIPALIFIPQMLYWKFAFGKAIVYSYGDEGFTHLKDPRIMQVLFEPNNGLLPYSFMIPVIIAGIILMLRRRKILGIVCFSVIAVTIYLTASWHAWRSGCGMGMRNMVEYYSLLVFPLCFLLQSIRNITSAAARWIFHGVFITLCLAGLKLNYHYFGCYPDLDWDWSAYFHTLLYPFSY